MRKILLLTLFLTLGGCGKKNESVPLPESQEQKEQRLFSQELGVQKFSCEQGETCPKHLVKLVNLHTYEDKGACLGSHIGQNQIITTSSCLGPVGKDESICDHLYLVEQSKDAYTLSKIRKCKDILYRGNHNQSEKFDISKDFSIIQFEKISSSITTTTPSREGLKAGTIYVWSLKGTSSSSVLSREKCELSQNWISHTINRNNASNINRYSLKKCPLKRIVEGSLLESTRGESIGQVSQVINRTGVNNKSYYNFYIDFSCIEHSSIKSATLDHCGPQTSIDQPADDPPSDDQPKPSLGGDDQGSDDLNLSDDLRQTYEKIQKLIKKTATQDETTKLFEWAFKFHYGIHYLEPICIKDKEKFLDSFKNKLGFVKNNKEISFFTYSIVEDQINTTIKENMIMIDAKIYPRSLKRRGYSPISLNQMISTVRDASNYAGGLSLYRKAKHLKLCSEK